MPTHQTRLAWSQDGDPTKSATSLPVLVSQFPWGLLCSRRAQAESQIRLLTEAEGIYEGDFYSYRYFAAEGFLPGYNFPRLPLSAFVPGRRQRRGRDEFVSRPRFLAISEFGPRALIYHEGARQPAR